MTGILGSILYENQGGVEKNPIAANEEAVAVMMYFNEFMEALYRYSKEEDVP